MPKDRRTKAELLEALGNLSQKYQNLNEFNKKNTLEHVDRVEGLKIAHKREVNDFRVKVATLERENERLEQQLANEVTTSLKVNAYFEGKADGIMNAFKVVIGRVDDRMGLPTPPDSPSAAEDPDDDRNPDGSDL